ncbi:MAG: hypothetical protein COX62_05340 [Deltaproteobacteria bacterium CG_4_10_14_0_2_um_filter_43_8]|nr:MAG: hypothetical protein COV43_08700 [Deltaproteobacteria bacterium CG11_big_fil_rev_8_21_14_0_20_42_23]PJA20110.1 MAG: hypothetical protein COX62_05340 [Deltaproteobacteria bacterium CG_4_10_14_0_2_um_filter_43_8]PJC64987.1 MAG: hypothetical protein CO021_01490 [Deltaproteobacteria bacterium CG_4_9_14_0_2_um_filter_42_21]
MDIVSHGLWGGLIFGRKSKRVFLWAFLFGVLPDLLSFGIFSLMNVLGFSTAPNWSEGLPQMSEIPNYVHVSYNFTHSLIVFLGVFFLFRLVSKKYFWPMLAWPLHILVDIPTHTTRFFATPFLWPLFEYKFEGISWTNPYIFFPNLILLFIFYFLFFFRKVKGK